MLLSNEGLSHNRIMTLEATKAWFTYILIGLCGLYAPAIMINGKVCAFIVFQNCGKFLGIHEINGQGSKQ